MENERCILCGRPYPAGLSVMGCLICFPCEKALLGRRLPARKRKRLCRIFPSAVRAEG